MSEARDSEIQNKYSQSFLIVIVILILIIFSVIYNNFDAIKNITKEIIKWMFDNNIIPGLIGGIVSSLIATVISFILSKEPKYAKDIKLIKKDIEDVKNNYFNLLNSLPQAIGGEFTRSLFSYHPHASERIAKILSNHAYEAYFRYCDRVVVLTAADTYKLYGIEHISINNKKIATWKLMFHTKWTWINDSQVIHTPLRDLLFALTAPEVALQSFMPEGISEMDAVEHIQKKDSFFKSKNYVRTTIPHPEPELDKQKEKLPDEMIDKLWDLKNITVKFGDEDRINIERDDLEIVDNMPILVYKAYRFKDKDLREKPLHMGKKLMIEYKGEILLPIYSYDNLETGFVSYPPSDVVAENYSITIIYNHSLYEFDEDESGCYFIFSRKHIPYRTPNRNDLPPGFQPGNGEKAMQLRIDEPMTDFHRVTMQWRNKNSA